MMGRARFIVLWTAWGAAVVCGFALLASHSTRAGESGTAPDQWTANESLARRDDRPTLLVFAHPLCPCTEATLTELRQLLADGSGAIDAHVLYFSPSQPNDDWDVEAAQAQFSRKVGATAHWDWDGKLARQFGVRTSGHVLFYDRAGKLRFDGGVTPARGQSGDNAGRRALEQLLSGTPPVVSKAPVFGCLILIED